MEKNRTEPDLQTLAEILLLADSPESVSDSDAVPVASGPDDSDPNDSDPGPDTKSYLKSLHTVSFYLFY